MVQERKGGGQKIMETLLDMCLRIRNQNNEKCRYPMFCVIRFNWYHKDSIDPVSATTAKKLSERVARGEDVEDYCTDGEEFVTAFFTHSAAEIFCKNAAYPCRIVAYEGSEEWAKVCDYFKRLPNELTEIRKFLNLANDSYHASTGIDNALESLSNLENC